MGNHNNNLHYDYLGGFVSSPTAMARLNDYLKEEARDFIASYAKGHGEPESEIRRDLDEYMKDSWVSPLHFSKVNRSIEDSLEAPDMDVLRELVLGDLIFTRRPIETIGDVEAHINIEDTLSASDTEAIGLYAQYLQDGGVTPLDDPRFVAWLEHEAFPDKRKLLSVVKKQRVEIGIDKDPTKPIEHMDVLVVPCGGEPYLKTLTADSEGSYLHALNQCVDGYIEPVSWVFEDEPTIFCNDDGKRCCIPNRAIYVTAEEAKSGFVDLGTVQHMREGDLVDIIYGDFVCVGVDPVTGDERSISPEEVSRVVARFGGEESIQSGMRECERIKEEERRIQLFRDIETGDSAIDKGYDDSGFEFLL